MDSFKYEKQYAEHRAKIADKFALSWGQFRRISRKFTEN